MSEAGELYLKDPPPEEKFNALVKASAEIRSLLRKQVALVERFVPACQPSSEQSDGWRPSRVPSNRERRQVMTLLRGIEGSRASVITLSETNRRYAIRDCLLLARSVVETAINTCYLLAAGQPAQDRMFKHALAKAWRDRRRHLGISGVIVEYDVGLLQDDPETTEAVAEFTGRNGREISEWTSVSIRDRLAEIGSHFGQDVQVPLQRAFFGIYRHASELLNGTFYGNTFTVTGPPRAGILLFEHPMPNLYEQHCYVLRHLVQTVAATLRCFAASYHASRFGEADKSVADKCGRQSWMRK